MSAFRHFEVKSKDPSRVLTGAKTIVLMDGIEVEDAVAFKFEVEAKGIARVTITYIGTVEIDGQAEYVIGKLEPKV